MNKKNPYDLNFFFRSLIYNFENCANVNSRLKITWKDQIKQGIPFARDKTQKQKNSNPDDGGGDASMSYYYHYPCNNLTNKFFFQ